MVRMYPEKFPVFTDKAERRRTDTEKRIYEALRDHLPRAFTVFWSVSWLAKRRDGQASDGEVDFIVIHPAYGVLIIEVKGGGIKRNGNTWTSTDRDGEVHEIDPFAQVKRQFFSLKNKLKDSPLTAQYSYPIARAVWFPNLSIGGIDLGLDAPREIILDMNDVVDPQAGILRAFNYWPSQQRKGANSDENADTSISQSGISALIRLLAPTYEINTSLVAEFLEEQEIMRKLTEEQFDVLDLLASNRRACISGCAGSGKTMLAVEKARRLANEGYKVLLTCYNRNLADMLQASLRGNERISVWTFSSLCEAYAKAGKQKITAEHRTLPGYYNDFLPNILMSAVDRVTTRFDAIVVDEGQDFAANWWIPLELTLSDPDDGIIYIFFDDNQKIFADRLGEFSFKEPLYHLTVNCRNTQSIHQTVLQYYHGNHQLVCPGAEGRKVDFRHIAPSPEAAFEEVRGLLHKLVIENKIPSQDIIILTPIKQSSVWQEGTRLGNFTLTWALRPSSPNAVSISTIQSFKGLERPVVIVTEMDEARGNRDALSYVALSRATNHLIVLQYVAIF